MTDSYHYTECGLSNIFLLNGYNFIETPRGKAISINDLNGLHNAIGLWLTTSKKNLSDEEIRFLNDELLLSQNTADQSLHHLSWRENSRGLDAENGVFQQA
jgi:hypothetical protein